MPRAAKPKTVNALPGLDMPRRLRRKTPKSRGEPMSCPASSTMSPMASSGPVQVRTPAFHQEATLGALESRTA